MGEGDHLDKPHEHAFQLVQERMDQIAGHFFACRFYRCKCGSTKTRVSRR